MMTITFKYNNDLNLFLSSVREANAHRGILHLPCGWEQVTNHHKMRVDADQKQIFIIEDVPFGSLLSSLSDLGVTEVLEWLNDSDVTIHYDCRH